MWPAPFLQLQATQPPAGLSQHLDGIFLGPLFGPIIFFFWITGALFGVFSKTIMGSVSQHAICHPFPPPKKIRLLGGGGEESCLPPQYPEFRTPNVPFKESPRDRQEGPWVMTEGESQSPDGESTHRPALPFKGVFCANVFFYN